MTERQTSNSVLLVRPAAFGFHAEAAQSNAFAAASTGAGVGEAALREFDFLAERLNRAGVHVVALEDRPEPAKPDAVFPNNWVSFHADGTIVLYPMTTAARRLEREVEALGSLLSSAGFKVSRLVDLSPHERDGRFLEGTGSLILDRPRGLAYASRSQRTDGDVIQAFDDALGYSTMVFDARDPSGVPIYHTNVLLSLGSDFAVLCTDAVVAEQRRAVVESIEASGRTIIEVNFQQLASFACNVIEVVGSDGPVIVLSSAARESFRPDQLRLLERFGELADAPIPTIESVGGGSVRCMIADIHLPRR